MEQRPVEAVHSNPPLGRLVSYGVGLVDAVAAAARAGRTALNSIEVIALSFRAASTRLVEVHLLLVGLVLSGLGGRVGTTNLGDAEDGLPAVVKPVSTLSWVSKASRDEGTLGPAVRDASNVPVDNVGSRVAVELVANIDQVLHRCNVHSVDGAEIENDGLESRQVGVFVLTFLGCKETMSAGVSDRKRKLLAWTYGQGRSRDGRPFAGMSLPVYDGCS